MSKSVSVYVDTYDTSEFRNEIITRIIEKVFDLRPDAIIDTLNLKRPMYANIVCYGQVGRSDLGLIWEK